MRRALQVAWTAAQWALLAVAAYLLYQGLRWS